MNVLLIGLYLSQQFGQHAGSHVPGKRQGCYSPQRLFSVRLETLIWLSVSAQAAIKG